MDPLRNFPGYALRRASNASLADLSAQLAKLDLRLAEATVLVVIGANPEIKQSEIGRMLGIASANMAPIVAKLDDRGLVDRIKADGRSHGLQVTPKGKRLADQAFEIMKQHDQTLSARIPEPMRETFFAALAYIWKDDCQGKG